MVARDGDEMTALKTVTELMRVRVPVGLTHAERSEEQATNREGGLELAGR